jgi:hypothetical protein
MNKTLLLSIFLTVSAQAETVYGRCDYDNATLTNLTCYGPAILKHSHVSGVVSVKGPLILINSNVGEVSVKGPLESHGSTINGKTRVYGPINAEKTTFNGDVFSSTSKFSLVNSTLNGTLTIESDNPSTLQLTASVITGKVIFSHAIGVIKQDSLSKINTAISSINPLITDK